MGYNIDIPLRCYLGSESYSKIPVKKLGHISFYILLGICNMGSAGGQLATNTARRVQHANETQLHEAKDLLKMILVLFFFHFHKMLLQR